MSSEYLPGPLSTSGEAREVPPLASKLTAPVRRFADPLLNAQFLVRERLCLPAGCRGDHDFCGSPRNASCVPGPCEVLRRCCERDRRRGDRKGTHEQPL